MSQKLHPSRLQITIQSDKLFEIINENYVFERLEITDYNQNNLQSLLEGSHLNTFMVKRQLMEIKEKVEKWKEEQEQ